MAVKLGRWAKLIALWRALRRGRRRGSPGIGRRLVALPRMVIAELRGHYSDLNWGRLALIVAGVIYVLSPVDILPELGLLTVGLIDDAIVVAWIARAVLDETERFLLWERDRTRALGMS